MLSSSRFALSLKPSVAYRVLNFCALWKKQTTLPSLAFAGIPYQVFGERAGALALMIACSRSAMARSGCGSAAIFSSTSLSPFAWSVPRPRRASTFSSWACSLIAARSSSVNPLGFSPVAVVLLGDFCAPFFAGVMSAFLSAGVLPVQPEFLRHVSLPERRRPDPRRRRSGCGVGLCCGTHRDRMLRAARERHRLHHSVGRDAPHQPRPDHIERSCLRQSSPHRSAVSVHRSGPQACAARTRLGAHDRSSA